MAFAITYMTLGILAGVFSRDIANAMNRFSVKFYEVFPWLRKALPGSRLAGSQLNYKTTLWFLRALSVLMTIVGTVSLGLSLLSP
jgi:hypothetical protein